MTESMWLKISKLTFEVIGAEGKDLVYSFLASRKTVRTRSGNSFLRLLMASDNDA